MRLGSRGRPKNLISDPKCVREVFVSAHVRLARAEALEDCIRRHRARLRERGQFLALPRVGGGCGLRLGDVGDAAPAEEDARGVFDLVGERIRDRGDVLAACGVVARARLGDLARARDQELASVFLRQVLQVHRLHASFDCFLQFPHALRIARRRARLLTFMRDPASCVGAELDEHLPAVAWLPP
jgi:hypothetical protein